MYGKGPKLIGTAVLALAATLALLGGPAAMAHNSDLSRLELKGPWSPTCPSINAGVFFKNDPTMRKAVKLAWSMSHEGTPGEHEVGFIAYQERRKTGKGYEYRTVIKNASAGPAGQGGAEVAKPPPIRASTYRTVMLFHTHPGPASEVKWQNDYPSDADIEVAFDRGIPGGIIWGSGPTWNAGDYMVYGGSFKDEHGNRVASSTPGANDIELEVIEKKTGKAVTRTFWFVGITQSARRWWGWSCPKTARVTGNSKAWVGTGAARGNRLTKRTIRMGNEGPEREEPPHPAVPGPGGPAEGSVAEQLLGMTGQSIPPEQAAQMEKALESLQNNPATAQFLEGGWEDRERVEFIPLSDEPVVCRAGVEKTYPTIIGGASDRVTASSSAKTTFTPLHGAEAGFTFVTEQRTRANAMGLMGTSGGYRLARGKGMAGASAVINGTMTLDYSMPARLELDLSLSQHGELKSPDPPRFKPRFEPAKELYWEATAIVADRSGGMVEFLRFPRVTCPVNNDVDETLSLPLPTPPEGEVYTVTLDCSQQGGNYTVVGPATVPGGWTEVSVTIRGEAEATLADPAEEEQPGPADSGADRPVG